MKKITAILLAMMIIFPFQSYAAITTTDNISYYDVSFSPARDQYILNYSFTGSANNIYIYFVSDTGTVWTKTWGPEAINKTIFINCNGEYDYFFKLNNSNVGYIQNIISTEIVTPICTTTTPGENEDNLNLTSTGKNDSSGTPTGDYRLNYIDLPDGAYYRLHQSTDGGTTWNLVDENTGLGGHFDVTKPGLYRLTAYNSSDEILSKDIINSTEFNNGKCDGCKTLTEMLACPAWDTYMSEFSEMISGAIPAPPSIEEGIDYLIEELAAQTVEPEEPTAPEPFDPGYEEIETDLPTVIETEIEPEPTDFEPETGGPGSGPVIITDPEEWTPDDTDLGYTPPAPDPDTAPTYNEPGGGTETPPTYTAPGGGGDTPPTYTPPGSVADTPPTYTPPGGTSETIPGYNLPGSSGGGVPDYDYN